MAQARERDSVLAGDLREAQAKLALLETRLAESQSQQAALEAMYRELAPSRDDLALNEVEQILLIANQQLALAGNVPAALAALQLADGKLARIDRPPLGPLRRALSRDVDRLRALPFIDVTAITLKLDQAIGLVDTLPLAKDERLPQPQARDRVAGRAGLAACARGHAARAARAGATRSERSAGGAAGRTRTGVLPSREPASAPAVRAHGDPRPAGGDVQVGSARRAGVGAQVLRHAHEARAGDARRLLGQMLATPLPDDLPDLAASLDAVRTLKADAGAPTAPPPVTPARPNR